MESKDLRFYEALDNYIDQKSNEWKEYSRLWCSIVGTVLCSLHLILSIVSDVINITGRG